MFSNNLTHLKEKLERLESEILDTELKAVSTLCCMDCHRQKLRHTFLHKVQCLHCNATYSLKDTIDFNIKHVGKLNKALTRPRFAYYKRSAKPWTQEEYVKILEKHGDGNKITLESSDKRREYVYDSATMTSFMHTWNQQDVTGCEVLAYEDVFDSKL